MKKLVFSLLLASLFLVGIHAQEEEAGDAKATKSCELQAGDYAVGFNAVPLVNFALNVVNIDANVGATAAHPGFIDATDNFIFGRYVLDKSTSVRIMLGVNATTQTDVNAQQHPYDTTENGDPELYEDATKTKNTNFIIGVGLEKRRGEGRLKGIYGGELFIGLNGGSVKSEYGITWDAAYDTTGGADRLADGQTRVLDAKQGLGLTVGLRGFVGVEYFFAKGMSIGCEFGLLAGMQTTNPRGKTEVEEWDNSDYTTSTIETDEFVNNPDETKTVGIAVDNGLDAGNIFGGGNASLVFSVYF